MTPMLEALSDPATGKLLATCSALGTPGLPDEVCTQALEGFEATAAARDLVCD